jgi:hypothetical protein
MQRYLILLFLIVSGSAGLRAQTWVSITAPRGNFSFSFPAATTPLDTLGLLSYNYVLPTDSTICFQVHFMDSVPISANPDLQAMLDTSSTLNTGDTVGEVLNVYAQLFQQFTGGNIEGFTDTTYYSKIRGEDLTILHPDLSGDSTQYFAFTRYFYYNSKFLAFTLTGPQPKLSVLNGYKNQLFASIGISW